jgi:hypothetical protein
MATPASCPDAELEFVGVGVTSPLLHCGSEDDAMKARWSEAWLLAAVDWSGGGDLAKIIGAADAINHPIPTDEEMEHAIRFLDGAGLVRFSDDSLHLTEEGRRPCKRTQSKDIFATLDRLHALLKNLPEVDRAADAKSVLDRSTYLSAMQRMGNTCLKSCLSITTRERLSAGPRLGMTRPIACRPICRAGGSRRTPPRPGAPDFERARPDRRVLGYPESRAFGELLIDCEEDRTLRALQERTMLDGSEDS